MIEARNPDYKERVEKFLDRQYFMHLIGFDLNLIEPGRTEGKLILEDKHKQQKGLVHGGLIATVADIVAGFAAYTVVPADHHVVTAEIKISYFHPGVGQELYAKGWVLKAGKKINFCEAEVWTINKGKHTLIAKATTSMAVIKPEDIPQN
jgi:uncharacterized protein (TIGR00369 family)